MPDGAKPGVKEGEGELNPGVCGEPNGAEPPAPGDVPNGELLLPAVPAGGGEMPALPSRARMRSSRLLTVAVNS